MRRAKNGQATFDFQPATLKLTDAYHERYRRIDKLLGDEPRILRRVHAELHAAMKQVNRQRKRRCKYTSENVLRLMICQVIEAASLREIVIRVDDSSFLRRFCGFGFGQMMSHTLFCSLRKLVSEKTWKEVNAFLAEHAVSSGWITGSELRLDTTACETNIHFPTDSHLLWDVYRTLARLITTARELDPSLASQRRLHTKRAKRYYSAISRAVGKRTKAKALKPQYKRLLRLVGHILVVGAEVRIGLRRLLERGLPAHRMSKATILIEELKHFDRLARRVVSQTTRRVLDGEKVPNEDKIFSVFEPHTELLKRGKAGRPIEFGHMVLFAQTREKFVSDYEVYAKKPVEHELVDEVIAHHELLFGQLPKTLAADKGFYESAEKLRELERVIDVVAIGKKGKRSHEETAREHSIAFKLGQAFRSGIEGTISYLKRCLRLHRCFTKGWDGYAATIGSTVFVHNLLVLARPKA